MGSPHTSGALVRKPANAHVRDSISVEGHGTRGDHDGAVIETITLTEHRWYWTIKLGPDSDVFSLHSYRCYGSGGRSASARLS